MACTTITIQPKPEFNRWPEIFNRQLGQLAFSYLTIPEQERVKQVAKGSIAQVESVQRQEIARVFPQEYLHLVGGSKETLKQLPLRIFDRPRRYKDHDPDHAVGWTQIRSGIFALNVLKREKDAYNPTATNLLVYHLVPEASEEVKSSEKEQPSIKTFIRFWDVDAPCCRRVIPFICCPNKLIWATWSCFLEIGACFGCTKTLTIDQEFPKRGYSGNYLIPPAERIQGGPIYRYKGIPYIPNPPAPPQGKPKYKVSIAFKG